MPEVKKKWIDKGKQIGMGWKREFSHLKLFKEKFCAKFSALIFALPLKKGV